MPKTLEQGFDKFLEWLVPSSSEHNKAISHKSSVKSSLVKSFGCSSLLETGSFGNGTGIRGYSDTDYFAVCPSQNLAGKSNYILKKVKESLQFTFHRTSRIRVNSPSVAIVFGRHASENLEITPCFNHTFVETPFGKRKAYAIPDNNGQWMLSSPKAHKDYVEANNKRLNGKLKPLIRLVKAWKCYNNVPINSFYLELRITKFCENKKKINFETDLYGIIKKLYDIQLASIQDPMKVSGIINACKTYEKKKKALSKLGTAYSRANKAYFYRNTNLDKCFYWWNLFFSKKFPKR